MLPRDSEEELMSIDITELTNLPVAEKLRIVELLWDNIANSEEPLVLKPWQLEEMNRRQAEIEADPSILIDEDELWRRVDG
jgi:putative addiction module component (TIGR02574 family)